MSCFNFFFKLFVYQTLHTSHLPCWNPFWRFKIPYSVNLLFKNDDHLNCFTQIRCLQFFHLSMSHSNFINFFHAFGLAVTRKVVGKENRVRMRHYNHTNLFCCRLRKFDCVSFEAIFDQVRPASFARRAVCHFVFCCGFSKDHWFFVSHRLLHVRSQHLLHPNHCSNLLIAFSKRFNTCIRMSAHAYEKSRVTPTLYLFENSSTRARPYLLNRCLP